MGASAAGASDGSRGSPHTPEDFLGHARTAHSNLCSLEGKTALVVGAGDLGAAAAAGLAHAGATVAIANRTFARAEELSSALTAGGYRAQALAVDLTDRASIERMVGETASTLGGLDAIVLGFGSNHRGAAADLPLEHWKEIIDTNLTAAFSCSQAAYPHLLERGGGRVIVIASAAAHAARPWPPTAAYGASKAGLTHLVRFLAAEWATDGITVNAISPGYFRTRLTQPLLADEETLDRLLSLTPMGRLGDLHEFIGPVTFLASDASSFITGQSIVVDGGRVCI